MNSVITIILAGVIFLQIVYYNQKKKEKYRRTSGIEYAMWLYLRIKFRKDLFIKIIIYFFLK